MSTNVLDQLDEANPIGTKFLVELEVIEEQGYTKLLNHTMIKEHIDKFLKDTGCRINLVYRKDVTIDNSNLSIKELLTKALEKL